MDDFQQHLSRAPGIIHPGLDLGQYLYMLTSTTKQQYVGARSSDDLAQMRLGAGTDTGPQHCSYHHGLYTAAGTHHRAVSHSDESVQEVTHLFCVFDWSDLIDRRNSEIGTAGRTSSQRYYL